LLIRWRAIRSRTIIGIKAIDLHHTRSQEQRAISAPSSSRYDGFRMACHQNINFEAEDYQDILPRARRERLPGIHFADRGADGRMRHDEPGESRKGRRRLPRLGGGAGRTLGAARRPAGHGVTRAPLTSLPRADPLFGRRSRRPMPANRRARHSPAARPRLAPSHVQRKRAGQLRYSARRRLPAPRRSGTRPRRWREKARRPRCPGASKSGLAGRSP
jgi:hypothetical protein